jgi:uncharacterized membrane protein
MAEGVSGTRRVNWTNLITVVSAAILIGTEIVGAGLATGWAIAGLIGAGEIGAWILEGVFACAALVVVYVFVRAAARVEPFTER